MLLVCASRAPRLYRGWYSCCRHRRLRGWNGTRADRVRGYLRSLRAFSRQKLSGRRFTGPAPTNMFLSAFGPIHVTPFGTVGEVVLIPDQSTRVSVAFAGGAGEYFYLG